MAPEMLDDQKYDSKVDIWSLGITGIDLATGNVPFDEMGHFDTMKKIKEEEPPKLEGEFSSNFKDFIDQCLIKAPKDRSSALELLEHPFVNHKKRTSILLDLLCFEERLEKEETKVNVAGNPKPKKSKSFKTRRQDGLQTVIGKETR